MINWFWKLSGWSLFEKKQGDDNWTVWVKVTGDYGARDKVSSYLFGQGYSQRF